MSFHPAGKRGGSRWSAIVVALLALVFGTAPAEAEPQRYVLDATHTTVAFLISHIGFAKTLGMFHMVSGSFQFDPDKPSVTDIDVTIDAASVDTGHAKRDEHLRSADFLDVAKYPTITFRGTSAEQLGPRNGTVTGDLTLHGVTHPVTLEVSWNKSGEYPIGDKHYATGISAHTTIKRSDFGMSYGVGPGLVGDDVEIILEFEAIRQSS